MSSNGKKQLALVAAITALVSCTGTWLVGYGTLKRDVELGVAGGEQAVENRVDIAEMKTELKAISKKQDDHTRKQEETTELLNKIWRKLK